MSFVTPASNTKVTVYDGAHVCSISAALSSLVSPPREESSQRSAGSFPEQRLVIELRAHTDLYRLDSFDAILLMCSWQFRALAVNHFDFCRRSSGSELRLFEWFPPPNDIFSYKCLIRSSSSPPYLLFLCKYFPLPVLFFCILMAVWRIFVTRLK